MADMWIATFSPRDSDRVPQGNIGRATDIRDALDKFQAAHPGEIIIKLERYVERHEPLGE